MSLQSDLFTYLTATPDPGLDSDRAAALATLQSALGGRVYPYVLAEGATMPAMRYQLIDNKTDHELEGFSTGLYEARVQIDIWSTNALQVITLGQALRDALDGWIAPLGVTDVNVLFFDNEVDHDYEPERLRYGRALDFKVLYGETVVAG